MNGVSQVRNILVRVKIALPSDLRTYFQPVIYGLVGGLSAVAFQVWSKHFFNGYGSDLANHLG